MTPPAARDPSDPWSATTLAPGRVLTLALGWGLLVGLLESVPYLVAARVGLGVRLGPHVAWMVPLADGALFLLVGLLLAGAGLLWEPARRRAAVVGVLAGLGALCLLLVIDRLHDAAVALLAAGLGVQAARVAHRAIPRRALRAAPFLAAFLPLVVGVQAWRSLARADLREEAILSDLPAASAGAPNVLLLILDTVRAASTSLSDGGRGPLRDLAARGVAFEHAVAPSPWTLPSHASMFTGRWPGELGVDWYHGLDATTPTLAEVLSGRGYATAGFVANLVYASRPTGLARGFARYEDHPVSVGQVVLTSSVGRALAFNDGLRRVLGRNDLLNRKDAEAVGGDLLRWLDGRAERADGRPWFAFLNFFDAHEPVFPPDSLVDGRWGPFDHDGGVLAEGGAWLSAPWDRPAHEIAVHRVAYAEAVGDLEARVALLLEALEARGELDNTVVVLASDHGEQLGERGLFGHDNSLYMPALHVPLVFVWPGRVPAGVRVERAVSLRDLPATVLDLVGAPGRLPGRSLAATWRGEDTPISPAIAWLTLGDPDQPDTPIEVRAGELHSIVRVPHQYIHNGDGTDELYGAEGWTDGPNLAGGEGKDSTLIDLRSELYEVVTGRAGLPDTLVFPAEPRPRDR